MRPPELGMQDMSLFVILHRRDLSPVETRKKNILKIYYYGILIEKGLDRRFLEMSKTEKLIACVPYILSSSTYAPTDNITDIGT